jgi:hypothetical protein
VGYREMVAMAKGLHPTDWARYGTRLAGTRRKG